MEQLKVDLGSRSYPIFIGSGLISAADCFAPYVRGRDVMIVSNETVAPLYLESSRRPFQASMSTQSS